eukprot:TRINITY_DN5721_c0_g2_i4.p1 TRINITY_DN5721_c0_g2~~TRINITY_DN5721_c0_g2_i4.p1  ORF type:complete len:871 (+),score=134.27 TRINITY_DN5721_c0_g2_i4:91-2703(+)
MSTTGLPPIVPPISKGPNHGSPMLSAKIVGGEAKRSLNTGSKIFTGEYKQLGRSGILEAQPAVVHFPGFQLQQQHEIVLRIVNAGSTRTRIQILPPTDQQHFSIRCDRKGDLAPGLSENIVIIFVPTEYKYYYDCLRIHGPDSNLLVPIHAYPTMNKVFFPKVIDFGLTAINEVSTKTFKLSCTVPIDFEFELETVEPHPFITITPSRGIVPANDTIPISVQYKPLSYETSRATIRVNISQFAFEPYLCQITATCSPGQGKEQAVKELAESFKAKLGSLGVPENTVPDTIQNFDYKPPLIRTGGGAGGGDPVVDELKQSKDLLKSKSQKISPDRPTSSEGKNIYFVEHDGVRFPVHMDTLAGTADIMTQQPGKLRVKELKNAITQRKAQQEAQSREQAHILDSMADTLAVFESEGSRQLKELAFEHEFKQRAEFERSKELRWFVCVGSNRMEQGEIDAVIRRRQVLEESILENEKAQDRQRVTSELKSTRVIHDTTIRPSHTPTYDQGSNILWLKRIKTLERFTNVARIIVLRIRIENRLSKIRSLLQQAEYDRIKIAELVVSQSRNLPATNKSALSCRSLPAPVTKETILPVVFPIYREQYFMDSHTVSMEEADDFVDYDFIPLKVPLQYEILGYKPIQVPPVASFVKPEQGRLLRQGADEEHAIRGPRGMLPQFEFKVPAGCKQSVISSPAAIMNPQQHIQVYRQTHAVIESHPERKLVPVPKPFSSFLKPCGDDSLRCLSNAPTVSNTWIPIQDDVFGISFEPEIRLLAGPQQEDNMSDSDDDESPLPISLPKPTDDWIRSQYELLSDEQTQSFREKKHQEFVVKTSAQRVPEIVAMSHPKFSATVDNLFDTVNSVIFNPFYRLKQS